MVVKLNNGAVREIKKAEPIVEKRFTFNGDTLRMVAKANSSKEDITGILFKLKDGRDDDISVFAVNEDAVLVGNLQYSEVQRILDMLLTKGYVDISVYDYQPKTSIIADTVFDISILRRILIHYHSLLYTSHRKQFFSVMDRH